MEPVIYFSDFRFHDGNAYRVMAPRTRQDTATREARILELVGIIDQRTVFIPRRIEHAKHLIADGAFQRRMPLAVWICPFHGFGDKKIAVFQYARPYEVLTRFR